MTILVTSLHNLSSNLKLYFLSAAEHFKHFRQVSSHRGNRQMSCGVTERVNENRPGSGGIQAPGTGGTSGPLNFRLRGAANSGGHTPTNSRNQRATMRRPLCWILYCCSCSCCCSTPGKGNDDNGPTRNSNNSDLLNYECEQPHNMEEIRSWGHSFDKLMRSTAGRKLFRDFLRMEYSEENILFWLACEELKKEENPEVVEEMARIIYEDYISILSPKEVSLDAQVREIVNRNMVKPTPHTFDEAQLQIYTLMHRDSYPRFVCSALYRSLVRHLPPEESVEDAIPPD
ncbi:regulator of G-protein signaling 17 isoform X1 [Harmonia axyridis]|uniref:regulator of G-protein signaling 17 isoform X1 n=2 Tax=Harmonia axyridis TaxID=115357 RepID=UPI001E276C61|nr:regulator of G-protein signaling 17 isoform X1 [Harmonia axyridis]